MTLAKFAQEKMKEIEKAIIRNYEIHKPNAPETDWNYTGWSGEQARIFGISRSKVMSVVRNYLIDNGRENEVGRTSERKYKYSKRV